jgi:hypothetical protein
MPSGALISSSATTFFNEGRCAKRPRSIFTCSKLLFADVVVQLSGSCSSEFSLPFSWRATLVLSRMPSVVSCCRPADERQRRS